MKTLFRFVGCGFLAVIVAAPAFGGDPTFDEVVHSPEKYEGKTIHIDHVLLSGDLTKGANRYRLAVKSPGGTAIDASFKPDGMTFVAGFDDGERFKSLLKEGEFRAVRLTCTIKAGGAKSKDKWHAHVSEVEPVEAAGQGTVGGHPDKPDNKNGGRRAEAGGATVAVVAEGVGKTADEALKDALRNAVRQVVGALVDAETVVKNDEVISDKVLTLSAGLVKKYEELATKKQDGLFRTTIRATVERTEVLTKLKAANVAVRAVDGKGLFAEAVTGLEREKDAKGLLAKKLREYQAGIVQAEPVGKPKVKDAGDAETTIEYEIRLSTDATKYEAFVKDVLPLLRRAATARGQVRMAADQYKLRPGEGSDNWVLGKMSRIEWRPTKFMAFSSSANGGNGILPLLEPSEKERKAQKDDPNVIAVCVDRTRLDDRQTWEWFALPKTGVKLPPLNCRVDIVGAKTRIITSNDISLDPTDIPGFARIDSWGVVLISPYIHPDVNGHNGFGFNPHNGFFATGIVTRLTSRIATGELKDVHGIRCTIEATQDAEGGK